MTIPGWSVGGSMLGRTDPPITRVQIAIVAFMVCASLRWQLKLKNARTSPSEFYPGSSLWAIKKAPHITPLAA